MTEISYETRKRKYLTITVRPLRVDDLAEAPAVWLDNGQRPDSQRMPCRGGSDRGTGAGRSVEGNDETAGDVQIYRFPSWRKGVQNVQSRNVTQTRRG